MLKDLYVSDTLRCHIMRSYKAYGVEKTNPPDPGAYMPRLRFEQTVRDRLLSSIEAKADAPLAMNIPVSGTGLKGVVHAVVSKPEGDTVYQVEIVHRTAKRGSPRKRAIVGVLVAMAKASGGILAEVSRDDFSVKETPVQPEDIRLGLEDWEKFRKTLESGEMPEGPMENWECRLCAWRDACKEDRGIVEHAASDIDRLLDEEPLPFVLSAS
jgi:hypothetical protein